MNGELKKYIYIIGTVLLLFFVFKIFVKIFPWLLLAGGIIYIITKVVQFIKGKNEARNSDKISNAKDEKYDYDIQSDDYTNGEVIDVEYEDVDSKK
ncbi:hypothetical protein [Clostridium saccharoperbutylacetonicum]|uniref:hypothetical protein n=1 Tax=Clostridium saccharoperbutylacetonicum TaxID=36745 RepID=UPI0039EC1958